MVKIYLVDDDKDDQFFLEEAVKKVLPGCSIHVFYNGIKCLEALKDPDKPRIIFSDLNMPLVNGHQVVEKIKGSSVNKNIPVYIITTSVSEKDITKSMAVGATGHYAKPANSGDYKKIVEEILAKEGLLTAATK
ncbi:MAG: response regulator [Bacteroidetes bacterium]|nr:response regulator [Bacteroidota bacterium]